MSRARKVRVVVGRSLFEVGPEAARSVTCCISTPALALIFPCHTLARLSICLSRLSSLAVPFPARRPRGAGALRAAGRWAALELAVDVDATLFSHTHSIQPAQRMCPKYSYSTV